jgi:hypothetical protein
MTEIGLESRLRVPPQVMSRLVGDETVILDLASGIYFGLDGVGKCIWESIANGDDLGGAVSIVVAEYDVEQSQAEADTLAFVNELVEKGLLTQ